MKKLSVIALIVMLVGLFGQICYGETFEELEKRFKVDIDRSKMTWDEEIAFENSDTWKAFEKELSNHVRYSDFSRMAFRMAGYEESHLERAKYLGYDKIMTEKSNPKDLLFFTRGNALRYLFLFNGYDTTGYEELFEDKNMVTWEDADELTKGIKPFIWNKEFANKEMWSDEEFIDFVNNNPDAPLYMWTNSYELNGKEIILVDKLKDGHKVKLSEHFTNIPDVNERVFQIFKIVTFNAVKHGGTAMFYSDEGQGYIWIGFNGDYLDAYDTPNFKIAIKNHPWEYKGKNTVITHTFNRMYTVDRFHTEVSRWNGIYPDIFKDCMKALYRDYYSDEMYEYFRSVADHGYEQDQDKIFNGIDVYYRAEDWALRVRSKIK